MKPILSVALVLGLFTAACQPAPAPAAANDAPAAKPTAPFQNLDVAAFAAKINDPNTVVLDVRTPAETADGMIEGAIEINFNDPTFATQVAQLDKDKTYLVYCRSGNRSARACQLMADQGFGNLYNLQGGMLGWRAAGK